MNEYTKKTNQNLNELSEITGLSLDALDICFVLSIDKEMDEDSINIMKKDIYEHILTMAEHSLDTPQNLKINQLSDEIIDLAIMHRIKDEQSKTSIN